MTAKAIRVLSITVERLSDDDPDLSYLGDYGPTAKSPESIDREERGDQQRGEYRFFNPSDNYNGDDPADRAKYTEQDYLRMEAYNRGAWSCIGIRATAQLLINNTLQQIRSGGIWGIESDSEEDYLAETEASELAELRIILEGLGIEKLPQPLVPMKVPARA